MGKLDDDSLMPWGIHKGKKMINVPAKYLLYMYNENKCDKIVKQYIEENMDALNQEMGL